jgi:hypothetical protein
MSKRTFNDRCLNKVINLLHYTTYNIPYALAITSNNTHDYTSLQIGDYEYIASKICLCIGCRRWIALDNRVMCKSCSEVLENEQ